MSLITAAPEALHPVAHRFPEWNQVWEGQHNFDMFKVILFHSVNVVRRKGLGVIGFGQPKGMKDGGWT